MRSEQSLQDFGVLFDAQYDSSTASVRLRGHPVVLFSIGQSLFELAEHAQETEAAHVATKLRPFAKSLERDFDNGRFSLDATNRRPPMRVTVPTTIIVAVVIDRVSRSVRLTPPWKFRVQDAQWRLMQSVSAALASERHLRSGWMRLQRHDLSLELLDDMLDFVKPLGEYDPPPSTPDEMLVSVERVLDRLLA